MRVYGAPPYRVAVLHGGPGAPGYMAPVARRLARGRGVLEPLQTATSLEGLVSELASALEAHAPVALVGSSWGAMLGFVTAARRPDFVRALVMVGAPPFDARYAPSILKTRLSRLNEDERDEVVALLDAVEGPRLGELFFRADAYDPLTTDIELIEDRPEVYRQVWHEVERFRADGGFIELAERIECPVVAIHGDHDPHPAAGVREPLTPVLRDFRFVLLERCGHLPWIERHAAERFFQVLEDCLSPILDG